MTDDAHAFAVDPPSEAGTLTLTLSPGPVLILVSHAWQPSTGRFRDAIQMAGLHVWAPLRSNRWARDWAGP
jgi:hypothetical protein